VEAFGSVSRLEGHYKTYFKQPKPLKELSELQKSKNFMEKNLSNLKSFNPF
jgi:hypothetical protein